MKRFHLLAAGVAALSLLPIRALSGTTEDGFRWMSENTQILREGVVWNDRFGDGKDRYKTGGLTQSWLVPERRISDGRWFEDHASALELQARGFVATPDNTEFGGAPGDRPFVQYAGVGAYLRTVSRPDRIGPITTQSFETRVGVEIGYQGDPLPFFELQEAIHGEDSLLISPNNSIDGEILANFEARRTARFHFSMRDADFEVAPYAQVSAGMRETSGRVGADMIYGSDLDGWTWNHEPAIGALIPGGSMPRDDAYWMVWAGGDVGYVAADAFLDGGFAGNGPSVDREDITSRFRAGVLLGFGDVAMAYSITFLSPEFSQQSQGQVIGAVSLKYNW